MRDDRATLLGDPRDACAGGLLDAPWRPEPDPAPAPKLAPGPRPVLEAAPPPRRTFAASLRLSGPLLSFVQGMSALPGSGAIVRAVVNEVLGIGALRRLPDAFRGELPDDLRPIRARAPRRWSDARLGVPRGASWPRSARDYLDAYAASRASPVEVAERALATLGLLARRSPPMNVLAACDPEAVRAAAAVSAARIAAGAVRPLEGVPFLAKDQHDVAGLPTRFGSRHRPALAATDATVVARLRAAGAIALGKSVMTEWGISPIGNNVHGTMPRNPHDPTRAAGGSSTGSAVAVALGIGPFATGGDAGGSVRIPAAWNGIFGLKPTFGRISRAGEAFTGSLNHIGALAASADDLARLLDAVASGPDAADPMTAWAEEPPRGGFGARLGDGVSGLRIGIDEHEWRSSTPEVAAACRHALEALERDGATLVPIRIPLAPHAPALGIATMGCEGVALARDVPAAERAHLAPDIQLAFNVAGGVSAGDFLDIQRLRVGLRRQLAIALGSVDVIALPTLPGGAPRLADRDASGSFSDAALVLELCRHTFLANLTGTPAASATVGVDPAGIPIGLQLVADAWNEAGLLAVLAHLERSGVVPTLKARGAVDLLQLGA